MEYSTKRGVRPKPTAASTVASPAGVNHNTSTDECRYYRRGMCRFGSLCRFVHRDASGRVAATKFKATSAGSSSPASSGSNTPPLSSSSSSGHGCTSSTPSNPEKWVQAPAFVPRSHSQQIESLDDMQPGPSAAPSYADVVLGPDAIGFLSEADGAYSLEYHDPAIVICPYLQKCPYGSECKYEHNELCELCDRYVLHPTDKEKRREHTSECIKQHETDMELSFAVARSKDKTCGICFEVIMEKKGREHRFGILPNCNHVYCLDCIRKWRQAKQFENNIIRACPECRIASDYVCPSAFWVDTKEEKDKLIDDYMRALFEKDCKYFKKGEGTCPFGNKCFYKHALPNGERIDVGQPKRRARKIQQAEHEIMELFDMYLWDFFERHEFGYPELYTDDDDSDDSNDFDYD